MGVFGSETTPPFAYTIGLSKTYNAPEIICVGLPHDLAGMLINTAVDSILDAEEGIELEKEYDNIANMPVIFQKMDSRYEDEYMLWNKEIFPDEKLEAVQMIFPDEKGLFYWQHGYSERMKLIQPILGEE